VVPGALGEPAAKRVAADVSDSAEGLAVVEKAGGRDFERLRMTHAL
jgi:hypothetical protein